MNKKVVLIAVLVAIPLYFIPYFFIYIWPNSYLRYLTLPKFKTVTEYYNFSATLACSKPILAQKQFQEVVSFPSKIKHTRLLYLPVNEKEAESFCKVIIME